MYRYRKYTSGKLSCDRIVDALNQLPIAGESVADPGYFEWCMRYLKVQWRTKAQRFGDRLSADGRIRLAKMDRKFPKITPHHLNDRIGRFQQSLDRFHGRRARRLAANLFTIE